MKFNENLGGEQPPKREKALTKNALCPSLVDAALHGLFSEAVLTMPEVVFASLYGMLLTSAEMTRDKEIKDFELGNAVSVLCNSLAAGMQELGMKRANVADVLREPAFAHFRLGLIRLAHILKEAGYTHEKSISDLELIKERTEKNRDALIKHSQELGHGIEGLTTEMKPHPTK